MSIPTAGRRCGVTQSSRPAESDDPQMLTADVRLFDSDGRVVLLMEGVLLKIANRQAMFEAAGGVVE